MSTTETPPIQPRPAEPPLRRADGVELVGEYKDSGFKNPPWIVRRADGQVVQLPRLLYLIAEHADGRRSAAEIGERVSHDVQRGVDANAVLTLGEHLRELGVLAAVDGAAPEVRKADPLLALKFRTAVVPERVTRALTSIFKPLYVPPVVVLVVLALLALDAWLLGIHGIDPGLRKVIYHPALLLVLLGGVVLSTGFHEIGHATACRYSGATPGAMGVGIYIVWPAFYTDVTDAYRLGKAGRLRTDLGGIYFNAIFALAMGALYGVSGFEPLLLLVLIQNFAILQQLLPFVRLDGYYIVSDLTGVPDMFARIKPVLESLLPWRRASDRVTELKPWVRGVVTGYVVLVVPLLLISFVLMVLHAPRAFATAYDSVGVQWDKVATAHGLVARILGGLQLGALVLPCMGMALTTGRIGRRLSRGAWTWSAGYPVRRTALCTFTGACIGLAAFTWWPNGEYRPIQPGERGTIQGGLASIASIPTGRPSLTVQRERQLGGAPSERDVLRGRAHRNAAAAGTGSTSSSKQGTFQDNGRGTATPTPSASPTTTPTPSAQGTPTPTPSPAQTQAPAATPAASAAPEPTATPTPTPASTP